MKRFKRGDTLFLLLFLSLGSTNSKAQIYFPDNEEPVVGDRFVNNYPDIQPLPPANLSAIRGTEEYNNEVDKIISNGILTLTLAIDKTISDSRGSPLDNVVFAPVSIAGALALVLMGSNGKTFQEIATVMGLATGVDLMSKSQVVHEQFSRMIGKLEQSAGFNIGRQVHFATAIFVQDNYPIRTLYETTAKALYQSEVLNVDFQSNAYKAQQVINAWVSDRTKGKIPNILADVPSESTKVIIASALYFKAQWEFPFFDGTTKRRPFFTEGRNSRSKIEVEMMSNGGSFPYFKDHTLNCEILGLPYKGNRTTMYIIMPTNSNKDNLKAFEKILTPNDINRLVSHTVYTPTVLLFPKMKIESYIDLKSSLETMGVRSLFNPSDANLALLSPGLGALPLNVDAPLTLESAAKNPLSVNRNNDDDVLIFSRMGEQVNCTEIFNPNNSLKICEEIKKVDDKEQRVLYKKIGNKVGRRLVREVDTLDSIRQLINHQSTTNSYQNPGLYADKFVHKVYIDITESGTEAAAASSVSLSRDGSRVTFRVDVPFLFFIWHEETKTTLFWGSITKPSPYFT